LNRNVREHLPFAGRNTQREISHLSKRTDICFSALDWRNNMSRIKRTCNRFIEDFHQHAA